MKMDLITACESNDQEKVETYLNKHPDCLNKVFKKHFEEATPLYFATQYGHLGIVNLLLKKGANANLCCTKKKRLPLHAACFSGFVNVIKFLAKKTSDVNLPDAQGLAPFHLACQSGELSCVEAIISSGCNVYVQDVMDRTGLDLLLHEDNLKVVRILLNRFPDLIDKHSTDGRNSFHYASQTGALACLRHMIQYFRDKSLLADAEGRLPVHYAASHGRAPVVNEFLVKGLFQVNEADAFCRTVAHHAAKSSSLETLHNALDHNPDLTIQDKNGNTVQHIACMNKPIPEMLVCLKNHGADFETLENKTHDTPFYSARKAANVHNLEKALKNELHCRHCDEREAKEQREASRRRLMKVQKKISDHGIGLYDGSKPPNTSRSMIGTSGGGSDVNGIPTGHQASSSRNGTQSTPGRRNDNFIDDVDHFIDNKKSGGYSHGNRSASKKQNGGGGSNRHANNKGNQGNQRGRDPYETSPERRELVSRIYGENSIFMIHNDEKK